MMMRNNNWLKDTPDPLIRKDCESQDPESRASPQKLKGKLTLMQRMIWLLYSSTYCILRTCIILVLHNISLKSLNTCF